MVDGIIGQLLVVMLLVGVNAFFAASEIAIVSLNTVKLKRQAENGDTTAAKLVKLTEEPSRFLATIQVGITLAGFFASASAAVGVSQGFAALLMLVDIPFVSRFADTIAFLFVTVSIAFFTLLLGELVPKRLAMQKPETIANIAAGPLFFLLKIANPFVRFLSFMTNLILRMTGSHPDKQDIRITEEEIRLMVDVGEEKGVIRELERDMIDNIFEFDDTHVSEVMTPRIDVVAVEINQPVQEVIEVAVREKYTRIPVYENSLDNIVGVLHTKDLLTCLIRNTETTGKPLLREMIRPAYFVPVYKKTDELLKELQANHNHMAVIIDEYGGTAGIITIEDLLEEIVGNIADEYDDDEKEVEKLDENTWLLSGGLDLDRVNDLLELDLPEDEYETLGGFVLAQLGRIPVSSRNESVEYGGLSFKVAAMHDKRITRVKVCKISDV